MQQGAFLGSAATADAFVWGHPGKLCVHSVLPHGISEEGDFHVVMCVIADIDMLFFSIIFSSTAVVKDEKHVTCPFPLRHV